MIDPGWLGSPIDVATFVVVIYALRTELRPRIDMIAAGVVALAEGARHVDDDRLQAELDVDDRDVEAIRPVVVTPDGGDRDR